MPQNPRGRVPGPLDSLPRPLAERERRSRGGSHRRRLVLVAVFAGVLAVGASAFAQGPVPVGGEVAGVVATPDATSPAASAAPAVGNVGPAPTAASAVVDDGPDVIPPARHGPPLDVLTGYRWPLPRGRLTLPFGPSPWGSRIVGGENFHDGIDLATFCGDRIVAAHAGVVLAAGRRYDRLIGWVGDLKPYLDRLDRKKLWQTLPIVVVIDDGNGYRSIYAHFAKVSVRKGQTVKAGQLLGHEGATGRASGCHLHYGLFSPDETARFGIDRDVAKRMRLPRSLIARVDPLLVLGERPPVKPVPSASAHP